MTTNTTGNQSTQENKLIPAIPIALKDNYLISLEVENFLSHKKSTFHFAPPGQLTVIVGESGSGKSSGVIRPLKLLLYNTPQGTNYIRPGCSFTRITGTYASGHKVIRERSASKNQYIIIDPGAGPSTKPRIFEGFGINVPLEVQEITRVRPIIVGREKAKQKININLAEQLDGAFLGKPMTDTQRAEVLGMLAGTEKLDIANRNTGTDLRRREQDEKRLKGELVEVEANIRKFDFLPGVAERIEKLELIVEEIKANQVMNDELKLMRDEIKGIRTGIDSNQVIVNRWHGLSEAESSLKKFLILENEIVVLIAIDNEIKIIQDNFKFNNLIVEKWKNIDSAEVAISKLIVLHREHQSLSILKGEFLNVNSELTRNQSIVESLTELDIAQTTVNQIKLLINEKDLLVIISGELTVITQETLKNQLIVAQYNRVGESEEIVNRIMQLSNQAARLNELFFLIPEIKNSVQYNQSIVNQWKNIEVVESIIIKIKTVISEREILASESLALNRLTEDIESWTLSKILHENRVKELQGAYRDRLVSLGVCPTCGATMDPLKMNQVNHCS